MAAPATLVAFQVAPISYRDERDWTKRPVEKARGNAAKYTEL